jgi:hypothetical protein
MALCKLRVAPVPGGPNMSTPFQGRRMPCRAARELLQVHMKSTQQRTWKNSGIHSGSTTASSSSRLASASPAMSSCGGTSESGG